MMLNLIFNFFETMVLVWNLKKYISQQLFYTIILQWYKPHQHKHSHNQCCQYGGLLAFNTLFKNIQIYRKMSKTIVVILNKLLQILLLLFLTLQSNTLVENLLLTELLTNAVFNPHPLIFVILVWILRCNKINSYNRHRKIIYFVILNYVWKSL